LAPYFFKKLQVEPVDSLFKINHITSQGIGIAHQPGRAEPRLLAAKSVNAL
jgi:hypothetical protein